VYAFQMAVGQASATRGDRTLLKLTKEAHRAASRISEHLNDTYIWD